MYPDADVVAHLDLPRPVLLRPGLLATRGPGELLLRILRYPYAVLRDLSRGEINLRAMGLVYTTLLSLIPLLAFSFAVLKIFGGHRDLEPIIYEFFKPMGACGLAGTHRAPACSSPPASAAAWSAPWASRCSSGP